MAVVADDRVTQWLSFDSLTRERQQQRLADTIHQTVAAKPRTDGTEQATKRLNRRAD